MSRGVVLYGPPASGKDTVDAALRQLSPRYLHYARLKVGPGRTHGYRMTTETALQALRERGLIIWENHRYRATYAIDAPGLTATLADGIPIVHLGQPESITALQAATPDTEWTIAALTTARDVATDRLTRRDPSHVHERLSTWDDTPTLDHADVRIDTGHVTPDEAARQIDAATSDCRI